MKVAHITPSFYPAHFYGGPTQTVYHLCRHLTEIGCEVRVLSTNANGPSVLDVDSSTEQVVAPGLKVRYSARIGHGTTSPSMLAQLRKYLLWADVVHLTAVYSVPTIPTLALASSLNKPVIWSPRGSLQRWANTSRPGLKAAWEAVCRMAAPMSTVLHVTSTEEAEASTNRMRGMRSVVIPNGVSLSNQIKTIGSNGILRLLYLGRLHPIKGLENLLGACQRMKDRPWELTVAGRGETEYVNSVTEQVERLELANRVRFAGEVTGPAKEKLFLNSDIVVVPSHTENFGMVVAEALAHGVPVVASRGTPWRRLEEFGCGLWVGNDPESLAAAVDQLSRMPLVEMGARGRRWMEQEFGWKAVARRMKALYGELAEARR